MHEVLGTGIWRLTLSLSVVESRHHSNAWEYAAIIGWLSDRLADSVIFSNQLNRSFVDGAFPSLCIVYMLLFANTRAVPLRRD